MSDWNSNLYLKFKKDRTQPSIDLAARLSNMHPQKLLDLGCGPGNSTAVLQNAFPDAAILGVDNSPNMIKAAAENYPALSFALCDASDDNAVAALGSDYDVVFSNACIQWVPDHARLLPRLMRLLNPGGVLAVQIPVNFEEPIHQIIGSLAASEKWQPLFPTPPRAFYTLREEDYCSILHKISADYTIWKTVYIHRLASHADVIDWYRSTGLRPYLQALSPEQAEAFQNDVYAAVQKAYPVQANGEILFRFPRLFFTATKGNAD